MAQWLRAAFAGLRLGVHDIVGEDDLVVVRCTMSGRHTGDFAGYDLEGRVAEAFAPTGATFATKQAHWLRIRDGQAVEHWANRDDLGTAEQLGGPGRRRPTSCAARSRRAGEAAPPHPPATRPCGRSAAGTASRTA